MKNSYRIAAWITLLLLMAFPAVSENAFFAFDNGVGRGTLTPVEQAALLKETGYAGIGYSGDVDLDARLKAFDDAGLRVFNIYVPCYASGKERYPKSLAKAIKQLKGTNVVLWLTVQKQAEDDTQAVLAVQELADLAAASNLEIALYPHHGFHVADIKDALRIVKQVDRDNVGLTFNLCHELRAGNASEFDALIEEARPYLSLVSINGADHEGNWDTLIQPLDQGAFDVMSVLKKLQSLNYEGPIGLQCYNVPGDQKENLQRSMAQWKKFQQELAKN